ncbi:chromate efflux transporter [Chitinophaga polysaccharea]|nr:chromate efflux transporter [Chitinophaga polysaccharea]NLU92626.1 chromate efflux transporter [Chitinophaga sp. Ak27]
MDTTSKLSTPSFNEALKFWFKLGWISFGGTAGHIAIMHEHLVEQKKWISHHKFLHALNHCMILPGPEAQQLAIYTGWLMHGKRGGIAAGMLFVLPSMFILLGLSILYVLYGNIPWVTAMFNGLKPAVIAIILLAMFKIARKSLHTPVHYLLAAIAFIGIFFLHLPFLSIIAGTLIFALVAHWAWPSLLPTGSEIAEEEPSPATRSNFQLKPFLQLLGAGIVLWLLPFLLFCLLGDFSFWKSLGLFFTQTAFVTIGGSYTVLPYVAQFTVTKLNWLTRLQMLDGFALAETTPGPLIIVLSFVGFMAGYNHFGGSLWMGTIGLLATTYFTFLPCFLLIFAGAPLIEKTQGHPAIAGALGLVTAAVVGVILNLTLYLGKDVLLPQGLGISHPDWWAAAWVIISLILLQRYRTNILFLVGLSILFGLLHHLLL